VLSNQKLERDFRHHIKLRGLLNKGNGLMPIESYRRKREDQSVRAVAYLPPLSTESPGRRHPPSPGHLLSDWSASKRANNRDIAFIRESPAAINITTFEYIYDDPKLISFMRE
jgi:hypothetical protein